MLLVYSSFFIKTKETGFLCFLCREERSEWNCSGAGREWRVMRMNGGRGSIGLLEKFLAL